MNEIDEAGCIYIAMCVPRRGVKLVTHRNGSRHTVGRRLIADERVRRRYFYRGLNRQHRHAIKEYSARTGSRGLVILLSLSPQSDQVEIQVTIRSINVLFFNDFGDILFRRDRVELRG